MNSQNIIQTQAQMRSATHKHTTRAVVAVLVATPLALFPASLVANIYRAFFWPYLASGAEIIQKISLLWFPELLRGSVVGALAILAARLVAKSADWDRVRLVPLCVYGGALAAIAIMAILMGMPRFDAAVVLIAQIAGLGLGLSAGEPQYPAVRSSDLSIGDPDQTASEIKQSTSASKGTMKSVQLAIVAVAGFCVLMALAGDVRPLLDRYFQYALAEWKCMAEGSVGEQFELCKEFEVAKARELKKRINQ